MTPDGEYLTLLRHIMDHGNDKGDRTGTGTRSIFGYQMRFDLKDSFPLLTTKKVHFKSIVHELLWFISGDTNVKYLQDNGVSIWDEWADEKGDLGPVYGHQWRHFGEVNMDGRPFGYHWDPPIHVDGADQIKDLLYQLKSNPDSRRMIVSAWNPRDIPRMALPPCHCLFQFYVHDNKLSCQLYQRSCDTFLGVPFNIASYALLTCLVAHVCDMEPDEFIWVGGDVHIYNNHFEQVKEQLERKPYPSPKLRINKEVKSLFDVSFSDIELIDYKCHPAIKAPIAV